MLPTLIAKRIDRCDLLVPTVGIKHWPCMDAPKMNPLFIKHRDAFKWHDGIVLQQKLLRSTVSTTIPLR
jgi:hypothetical protein